VIDVGEALQRESGRFRQDPGARERLYRRRDRKRRNQRIAAGVLGVAISIATITALLVGSRVVGVPAQPSATALNGEIAFARALNHGAEPDFATYVGDPDGTDLRKVPGGESYQAQPRWSSDGRKLAITEPEVAAPGCAGAICTAVIFDLDTGIARGLPWPMPGNWDVDCFPWSPDGARLACGAIDNNGTGLSGIYTIRSSDGGDPVRITPCAECVPGDFSPSGGRLVYAAPAADGVVGLFVVGIDGTGRHRITPPGIPVNAIDGGSWSPNGEQIVFQGWSGPGRYASIWIVNADGSGSHEVPIAGCGGPTTIAGSGPCRFPTWSPDGTRIAFSRRFPAQTATAGIYAVNPDGSGLVRITNNGLGDTQPDWGTHPPSSG